MNSANFILNSSRGPEDAASIAALCERQFALLYDQVLENRVVRGDSRHCDFTGLCIGIARQAVAQK
jgi:hypothetical protein